MKALLRVGDFAAWRIPLFLDRTPTPSAIIVLQGRLDTDIAAHLEIEIGHIIKEVDNNGHIILHGDAGDFGFSSDFFHSNGLETIDGRGVKMLFDCYTKAIPRNIQFIFVLSAPLLRNRTLPFPVLYGSKAIEEYLCSLHALPA